MAETESVTILKFGTDEAIKSVGDLRENIKQLQRALNGYEETVDGTKVKVEGLEIGTEEYQATVQELTVNQLALRNAMNGTSASMADVVKASRGVGTTYNSLVAQMKTMKQEIRNVDVSTEEGKQRFAELAVQIDAVNDQLKAMDADMGNYQRNVGNYKSAWDGFGEVLQGMPPFMGQIKQQGENIHKSFGLLSKNPIMGTVALFLPIIVKIAEALKENTTVTNALKKAFDALQPVFDFLAGVLEKIAGVVADVIEWFVELLNKSGDTFKKIISGAVGVGNAIGNYLLLPVRTAIEAFKGLGNIVKDVFTGNWDEVKQHATEAFDGIKGAFQKSFSFKENYEKGKAVADQFIDGMIADGGKKAKKAGKGIGKAVADGIKAEIDETLKLDDPLEDYFADLDKRAKARAKRLKDETKDLETVTKNRLKWNALQTEDEETRAAQAYEIQRAANEARLQLLRDYYTEAEALEDYDGAAAAFAEAKQLEVEMEQAAYEEKKRIRDKDTADAKEKAKQRLEVFQASASAVSGLLGSLADAYENEAEGNEKAAQRAKALRIAGAVIDTISGALAAYTSAQSLPVPFGPIIGAINAAAVTAAGIAQIAKIKATKVGSGDSAGGSVSVPTVSAPAVAANVPEVRNVTSASEEERLNKMASDQKVYILNSDLEANAGYHQAQVAEATW